MTEQSSETITFNEKIWAIARLIRIADSENYQADQNYLVELEKVRRFAEIIKELRCKKLSDDWDFCTIGRFNYRCPQCDRTAKFMESVLKKLWMTLDWQTVSILNREIKILNENKPQIGRRPKLRYSVACYRIYEHFNSRIIALAYVQTMTQIDLNELRFQWYLVKKELCLEDNSCGLNPFFSGNLS